MSDQADTTQDQQIDTGQQETAPDPVMARLDELTAGLAELRQPQQQDTRGLSDYAQQPFQPAEEEDGDDGYDAYDESPDVALQQLEALISSQVDQRVQPFLAAQQQQQVQQQAQELEAKYPDLKDPAVVGPLFAEAQRSAQQIGNPDLAFQPKFIEMFYLAQKAGQFAAQETPADGGTGVHMEGGAGQPQAASVDERDRIVSMGKPGANSFGWF